MVSAHVKSLTAIPSRNTSGSTIVQSFADTYSGIGAVGRVDNWSRERLLSPFFANQGGCSYAILGVVLEQPTSQMRCGVQSGGKRDGRSLVIELSTRHS